MSRLRRAGWGTRSIVWQPGEKERFAALWKSDRTVMQIAAEIGTTQTRVRSMASKLRREGYLGKGRPRGGGRPGKYYPPGRDCVRCRVCQVPVFADQLAVHEAGCVRCDGCLEHVQLDVGHECRGRWRAPVGQRPDWTPAPGW